MAKRKKSKRLFKILLLVAGLFILLPSLALGSYGGLNYYQAKKLLSEASSLIAVGKADEAIEKLAIADSKWVSKSVKTEISVKLEAATNIKNDKTNFDRGLNYYDLGKYEDAKLALEKVPDVSQYYKESQEKLTTINEKLQAEEKKRIQTAKSRAIVTPTPLPTMDPNLRQICENEMNIYINNLTSKLVLASYTNPDYQKIAQTYLKASLDADIHRRAENAGYQFFNDCLAGNKRLKDMTY